MYSAYVYCYSVHKVVCYFVHIRVLFTQQNSHLEISIHFDMHQLEVQHNCSYHSVTESGQLRLIGITEPKLCDQKPEPRPQNWLGILFFGWFFRYLHLGKRCKLTKLLV